MLSCAVALGTESLQRGNYGVATGQVTMAVEVLQSAPAVLAASRHQAAVLNLQASLCCRAVRTQPDSTALLLLLLLLLLLHKPAGCRRDSVSVSVSAWHSARRNVQATAAMRLVPGRLAGWLAGSAFICIETL